MFISEPFNGNYYIAELSRKGCLRLMWSMMPVEPVAADSRVAPCDVPRHIRRQAYRKFERLRLGTKR